MNDDWMTDRLRDNKKMYMKEIRNKLFTAVLVTTAILWDVTPSSLAESGQMVTAIFSKISANSTRSHGATFQIYVRSLTFDVGIIYQTIRQFGAEQNVREKTQLKKVLTVKENERFDLFVLQMKKGSI